MAREEFNFFESALVCPTPNLSSPVSPEVAACIYMENVISDIAYMSLLQTDKIEPDIVDKYERYRQWLEKEVPSDYWEYQEKLDAMVDQIRTIPDLLRSYIGTNFHEDYVYNFMRVHEIAVNNILPTLEILKKYDNIETRHMLEIAEQIANQKFAFIKDMKKFSRLLTELYTTMWDFFISIDDTCGLLFKLIFVNPSLSKPFTVHLTDDDITNIFKSMFMQNNQKDQVNTIKSVVKSIVNDRKWDFEKIQNLHKDILAHPTPTGILAYTVLLQPLLKGELIGSQTKNRRNYLTQSVVEFTTALYGSSQVQDTGDDLCDNLFELFDKAVAKIVKDNSIVPQYAYIFVQQAAIFFGGLDNDIVWIMPEITDEGDENNAIGISKDKILKAVYKIDRKIPYVAPFLNKLTIEEFVYALFPIEFSDYYSMLYGGATWSVIVLKEGLDDFYVQNQRSSNSMHYELNDEQLLILSLANVYATFRYITDNFDVLARAFLEGDNSEEDINMAVFLESYSTYYDLKGAIKYDPWDSDKDAQVENIRKFFNENELFDVVDFIKRIIPPSLYISLFFELYKQNKELAFSTLVKDVSSKYIDGFLPNIPTLNDVKLQSYSTYYMDAYLLQKMHDCLQQVIPNSLASVYSDILTSVIQKGLDHSCLIDIRDANKEVITVYGLDSKTVPVSNLISNVLKSTGISITVESDKWEDLYYKLHDINLNSQKQIPVILEKYQDKYRTLQTFQDDLDILVSFILRSITYIIEEANELHNNAEKQFDHCDIKIRFRIYTYDEIIYYNINNKIIPCEYGVLAEIQQELDELIANLLLENGISKDDIQVRLILPRYLVGNTEYKSML